jgi:hypothetical protein
LEVPGDVVFSRAGTFTVTFTVSDNQGNHDTTPATLEVTVLAPAPAPAPVTVSSSSGGGGGGGCTLDPHGAVDFTLLIVLSGILAYVAWRRRARARMWYAGLTTGERQGTTQ